MSRYQIALDNLENLIKVLGTNKYKKHIKVLQELVDRYQIMQSNARERAIEILKDTMLYGDFYYKIEDWLTECLCGNITELPYEADSEYLKCALRILIKEYFERAEATYNDEDIENVLDSLSSEYVIDLYYVEPKIHSYLIERNNLSMEDLNV